MLARQRQALILDRVRETGAVRVAELARELGVSDMTVRRDLEILHEHGLLEKVHGGATVISGFASYEPGFIAKSALQQDEKAAIAAAAAALVEPGMAIAISAGTTTHALAATRRRDPGRHGRHQLAARGRRPVPVRPAGPDGHPDRRRADAVGGARRVVRRRPAALGAPRPRVHGRPRHGCQGGLHVPEPLGGRDGPRPDRGGSPARRDGGPQQVGRDRDRVHRPAGPGRRDRLRPQPRPGGAAAARRDGARGDPRRRGRWCRRGRCRARDGRSSRSRRSGRGRRAH